MRLILIRHAETDGNKHRYVGREDLPLNAHGEEQVTALDVALAAERIDVVLASPLERARRTAEPLAARRGLEVQIRPALLEIDFGAWQGNAKGTRPHRLRKEHAWLPMPGGESLHDVWQRLLPLAAELRELTARDLTPAVVGHYWANRLLAGMLTGRGFEQAFEVRDYLPANASAWCLEEDGAVSMTWLHGRSLARAESEL